jgi:hypothetical protein
MTERYSHLSPAHKRAAVELLPKGLFYYAGTTQILDSFADPSNPVDKSYHAPLAQGLERLSTNHTRGVFGGFENLEIVQKKYVFTLDMVDNFPHLTR